MRWFIFDDFNENLEIAAWSNFWLREIKFGCRVLQSFLNSSLWLLRLFRLKLQRLNFFNLIIRWDVPPLGHSPAFERSGKGKKKKKKAQHQTGIEPITTQVLAPKTCAVLYAVTQPLPEFFQISGCKTSFKISPGAQFGQKNSHYLLSIEQKNWMISFALIFRNWLVSPR